MAPIHSFLIISGYKKKEPRYVYLSEAKASHSHKMWTEVSSSVPHFLQVGLLFSPIIYRCLLKEFMSSNQANNNPGLCPIEGQWSSPCSQVRARDQFSSLSLCTTRTTLQYQMLFFHPAFHLSSYILPRDPKKGSGPTNHWTEPSPASLLATSFPRTPARPGTQYSPTACRVEISFNAFWHCRNKGDVVLAASSAFRVAWLSEQIPTYFSGRSWVSVSWTQTKYLIYLSLKNCSMFSERDAEASICRLLIDPSLGPLRSPGPIRKTDEPFNLLKTKRRMFYLKTQFVPRCKHFSSRL